MNNNRGGNNRRRGRSNNTIRPQGGSGVGGGGQQVNRIDSRARGNAPQMLEKYRKLANDAHLNGDRVNAEYNLQFADHYFRVIADTRVRQEEQRLRRDDRWQEGDNAADDNDDAGEFGGESEFPAFDQPPVYTRREREDRPERSADRPAVQDRFPRAESQPDRSGNDRAGGNGQQPMPDQRSVNAEEAAPAGRTWSADTSGAASASDVQPAEPITAYEPPENPFLRENRGGRGLRPRREDRRPRREDRPETLAGAVPDGEVNPGELTGQLGENPETDRISRAVSAGIDPTILPPSFTVPRDEPPVADETPAPAPRRRARRKPVAEAGDGAGEPIQSLI